MATFPGAIPSYPGFVSGDTLKVDAHASQHNSEQGDISAIATKIGTGSSTPTSGVLLRGNGVGTSAWAQVTLTSDVTGVLPQANGGTGTTLATGTGKAVYDTSPTISGATLTSSPTIADFTNATHTHATNAQGGQLNAANALQNTTVSANKMNLGGATAAVTTDETFTLGTYTDAATVGPSVTVTIGVNGLALIFITSGIYNSGANATFHAIIASGANTIAGDDTKSARNDNTVAGHFSSNYLLTGLAAGSTTFKLQYRTVAGTGHCFDRTLTVIPL